MDIEALHGQRYENMNAGDNLYHILDMYFLRFQVCVILISSLAIDQGFFLAFISVR
jgi:hypothetical protein